MRITKWGEFGILCCLYLARRAEKAPVGATDIAAAQMIPLQYTQQILQRLRKGKIIESVRGPHGGYRLVRTPAATTLREILYAAEGDTFENICEVNPVYPEMCGNRACGLKVVWEDLKVAIDQLLEKRTLAEILILEAEQQGQSEQLVAGPTARVAPAS